MSSRLERLLSESLHDAGTHVQPSDDLFDRIRSGIDADRHRRRTRRRLLTTAGTVAAFSAGVVITLVYRQGEPHMDWWILELITFAVLSTIVLVLGPFIKRFGRSYAADLFRSNPSTGKSFIVLTDFVYYLIFGAYILLTSTIDRPRNWARNVGAEQIETSIARIGGMLLLIGLLHGINLMVLPIIGRLLTLNRRLDQQMREVVDRDLSNHDFDQPDD